MNLISLNGIKTELCVYNGGDLDSESIELLKSQFEDSDCTGVGVFWGNEALGEPSVYVRLIKGPAGCLNCQDCGGQADQALIVWFGSRDQIEGLVHMLGAFFVERGT